MISRRSLLSLPALAALPWRNAFAADYPQRPLRAIVPVGTGSATDILARHLAQALQKSLGQPVVVDNRVGAGGVIGTDLVAKAPADGYTLLFTYAAHYTNQFVIEKTPYDAVRDFEPVAQIASSPLIVATAADSPLRTLKDLVDKARKSPGTVSYGTAGNGTTGHMGGAWFARAAEVQLTHVPYKSPGQAVIDAAGSLVDFAFVGTASALPLVRSGRLRVLAVTSARRSSLFPDAPTLAEAGFKGYELVAPVLVFAPRGTPAAVVSTLSREIMAASSTPEFKALCDTQGLDVDLRDAAACKAGAAAELARWKHLVELTR